MGATYPPSIDGAFGDQPELRAQIHAAIDKDPKALVPLLTSIATYVADLKTRLAGEDNGSGSGSGAGGGGPTAKKRKIENLVVGDKPGAGGGGAGGGGGPGWHDAGVTPTFAVPGSSFQVPLRKKLDVEVVAPAGAKAERNQGVRAVNPATKGVEFGMAFADIEHVFCLPVPEKAKRQDSFVILARHGEGIHPPPEGVTVPEPMVWTSIEGPKFPLEQQEQEVGQTTSALNVGLKAYGKKVIFPSDAEFVSNMAQAHRKGEKAYHVKAFKGSKEGFLYFLESGILFAFKKPLLFFPFSSIASISYTSVLQRTFNLLISTQSPDGSGQGQDFEFSMLDQGDYTPIDEYIQGHGLNDASMAEARRAKRLNINGPPEAGENGAEEESELQKAADQLEDEEDEEEEDYDPGSEGDSEGSGSDSEDDDDDDDEDEDDEDDDEMDDDGDVKQEE